MLSSSFDIDNDFVSAFYIRISFQDGLGIILSVEDLAESQGVSIHSILKQPITDRMAADTAVVTTEACKYSQVKALCELIEEEDFALSAPVFFPMIMISPTASAARETIVTWANDTITIYVLGAHYSW